MKINEGKKSFSIAYRTDCPVPLNFNATPDRMTCVRVPCGTERERVLCRKFRRSNCRAKIECLRHVWTVPKLSKVTGFSRSLLGGETVSSRNGLDGPRAVIY